MIGCQVLDDGRGDASLARRVLEKLFATFKAAGRSA
jgi:hypothetical protein